MGSNDKKNKLKAGLGEFSFKLRKQRLKYGTVATILTICVVAAVILLNVLVGFLTDRFGLTFDMTSEQRFSLTDETKGILKDLDEDVNVYIFMTEENFRTQTYGNEMAEILHNFEVSSNYKVKVEYIDPLRNPGMVAQFQSETTIASGTMVVKRGDLFRAISLSDLYYYYDSNQDTIVGVSIERKLAINILYTASDDRPLAGLLWGHGEENWSTTLASQLSDANYDVVLLNLQTDEIPDEVDLLVMCAPTTDYTETEIEKLEGYLASYKNFVYCANTDAGELTNLELYFREWGVAFDNSVICDSRYRVYGNYAAIITVPGSSADDAIITGIDITNFVVMPNAKPLSLLWTEKGTMTSQELLQSSTTSYAKSLSGGAITSYEKADGDVAGTFSTAILVTDSHIVSNVTVNTNCLFLSSPQVFNTTLINTESYGNMRFTTNVFSDFGASSKTVTMRSKKYTDPELNVIGNSLTVMLVLLCAIPVAIILFGIIVWRRRKNR